MQILFLIKNWGYNIITPCIKNPPENTTKLGDSSHSVSILTPTPKASQNEKTLYVHTLLDVLSLLPRQIDIH